MTRSIPSIIVLTLMSFTISYGLVRFPDAGILDAALTPGLTSDSQTVLVMKQTSDGAAIQYEQSSASSALPESQASSEELFVSESTVSPKNDSADSDQSSADQDSVSSDKLSQAAPETSSNTETSVAVKEDANPAQSASEIQDSADKPENHSETTEAVASEQSALENELDGKTDERLALIEAPDNNDFMKDDTLPIETDQDPFPMFDPLDSDVPSIVVDSDSSAAETEVEPLTDSKVQEEAVQIPEMTPEQAQSVDDYWDNYLSENSPSKSLTSNKDSDSTDSDYSSSTENQEPAASEPLPMPTDPNAQEIPARNREKKSANRDALTQPALNEPPMSVPNPNQPDTGTIPLESFPLEAAAMQKVNYTVDYQQEPYDSFGFNVPATGPIIVRRLPSTENSIDPIYNNAQLDRFAL